MTSHPSPHPRERRLLRALVLALAASGGLVLLLVSDRALRQHAEIEAERTLAAAVARASEQAGKAMAARLDETQHLALGLQIPAGRPENMAGRPHITTGAAAAVAVLDTSGILVLDQPAGAFGKAGRAPAPLPAPLVERAVATHGTVVGDPVDIPGLGRVVPVVKPLLHGVRVAGLLVAAYPAREIADQIMVGVDGRIALHWADGAKRPVLGPPVLAPRAPSVTLPAGDGFWRFSLGWRDAAPGPSRMALLALWLGGVAGLGTLVWVLWSGIRRERRAAAAEAERTAQLSQSLARLDAVQRIARLGHWSLDLASGRLTWSDEAGRALGLGPGTGAMGGVPVLLAQVHPDDRQAAEALLGAAVAGGGPVALEHRVLVPDGTVRFIAQQVEATPGSHGGAQLAGTVQDITERRSHERELLRANRALDTIGRCSRALTGAEDERSLLEQVCALVVESGYRLAWVGFAENDAARSVRPAAQAGYEAGYLETLAITWADTERGRGPTGTAVRTGEPAIVRDVHRDPRFAPWREAALQRGYASAIALPLKAGGRTLGALNIYAAEPDAFDGQEVSLLQTLANDLVVGVEALRTRAAQHVAESALEQSRRQLRTVIEHAPLVLYALDREGRFSLLEGKGLQAIGLQAGALMGKSVFELYADQPQIIGPVGRALAGELTEAVIQVGRHVFDNHFTLRHDADGAPDGIIGIATDITARRRAEQAQQHSDALLRATIEQSTDGVSLADADGDYVLVNRRMCEMTGYSEDELLHMNLRHLLPPGTELRVFPQALAGRPAAREFDLVRKDGTLLPTEATGSPVDVGDSRYVLGIMRDVSERRAGQSMMRKLSSAVEQTADAVIITDRRGVVEYVNRAFEEVTGYTRADIVGRTTSLLKSGHQTEAFYRKMWETILAGDVYREVLANRRKDGSIYYEEKTITPLKDERGEITHFVSTGKDITERIESQERLQYLAHHDTLTHLPNRFLFTERLEHALVRAARADDRVALLYLDLDRFKLINDTLGHEAGDSALRFAAERIRGCLRAGDTVARLGGDEFTVMLEELESADEVPPVVEKIRHALSQPFQLAGREFHASASIGVSIYPDDGCDAQTLLRNADIAMYRAKDQGRNAWRFYSAEMSTRVVERVAIEAAVRRALSRGELSLHFQPQLSLDDRRIAAAEALLRWRDPERGMIPPDQFVPVAEDTGLIVEVDRWVLRQAAAQASAWRASGLSVPVVAVNVSARSLADPQLANSVAEALRESGLPPSALELEITESAVMEHPERTLATLCALHDMGVSVAVDDFGTGYFSLANLRSFPIDVLKVDRSFVRHIPEDASDASIVSAVVVLAHRLGLRVVAEGVETAAQLEFLREAGCDMAQGYLLSHPLPAHELAALLAKPPAMPAQGR